MKSFRHVRQVVFEAKQQGMTFSCGKSLLLGSDANSTIDLES